MDRPFTGFSSTGSPLSLKKKLFSNNINRLKNKLLPGLIYLTKTLTILHTHVKLPSLKKLPYINPNIMNRPKKTIPTNIYNKRFYKLQKKNKSTSTPTVTLTITIYQPSYNEKA